jgi:hypothetical protein
VLCPVSVGLDQKTGKDGLPPPPPRGVFDCRHRRCCWPESGGERPQPHSGNLQLLSPNPNDLSLFYFLFLSGKSTCSGLGFVFNGPWAGLINEPDVVARSS